MAMQVTPASYLELLTTFIKLLAEKRKEIGVSRQRLEAGLSKLLTTAAQVEVMQVTCSICILQSADFVVASFCKHKLARELILRCLSCTSPVSRVHSSGASVRPFQREALLMAPDTRRFRLP